jgi:hypothetical protein
MNDFILRAKAWQVFLILVLPMVINNFFNGTVHTVISILNMFFYLGWLLIVATTLSEKLKLNTTIYIICVFCVILGFSLSALLVNPGETVHFSGIPALGVMSVLMAFLYVVSFTAKVLVSQEKHRNILIKECLFESFLFFFFFIGVWFLQPRINKVYESLLKEEIK